MHVEQIKNHLHLRGVPAELSQSRAVWEATYLEGLIPSDGRLLTWVCDGEGFLARIDGRLLRTYRMRSNWNGYHDGPVYLLPTFEEIGQVVSGYNGDGFHRNVWVAG